MRKLTNTTSFLVGLLYIAAQDNTYAVLQPYEQDVQHYTTSLQHYPTPDESPIRPLISGAFLDTENINTIKRGEKAAVTVCTTPLNSLVDHVSLVFELVIKTNWQAAAVEEFDTEMRGMSPPTHLSIFNVHFGGDGDSECVDKNAPIIDDMKATLRKIYRGQRTASAGGDPMHVDPVYVREVVFIVPQELAQQALTKAEKDTKLTYSVFGRYLGGDNCCTYASKLLKSMGIRADGLYAGKFVGNCRDCALPDDITRKFEPQRLLPEKIIRRFPNTSFQSLTRDKKGIMILCFQENNEVALAFETFLPETSDLTRQMFRVDKTPEEPNGIIVNNRKKAYGFAHWVLSNHSLRRGITMAERALAAESQLAAEGQEGSYILQIMRAVGLEGIHFLRTSSRSHLENLIYNITPDPQVWYYPSSDDWEEFYDYY